MDEEVVEEEEADAMTGRCTTVLTSCQDEASEKLGFAELLSSQKNIVAASSRSISCAHCFVLLARRGCQELCEAGSLEG